KGRNVIAQGKRESAPPCCESAIHLLKPCKGDTSHSAAAGAAALDSRFRGDEEGGGKGEGGRNDEMGGNNEITPVIPAKAGISFDETPKGNLPQNTTTKAYQ
ncbi:MAG: hypothetical protein ACR2P4_00195, partial [Gammaproteobacteria bacterium]